MRQRTVGLESRTTVHWHGLRLENRYDGTAATQQAIPIRVGQRVKIRLVNEMDVEPNLVWKNTVLVPTGQATDILLNVTRDITSTAAKAFTPSQIARNQEVRGTPP